MAALNPKSTASIAGHPIHPMLIPFPIALFVSAFVCDIVYWQSGNAGWTTAALWLIGGGLIMGVLAAVAGLTDVFGDARIRALKDVWWHAGGNVAVVLIELISWYMRYTEGPSAVVPAGITLSLIVTGALLFTGWKGWNMVYRHRVGVSSESETVPESRESVRTSGRSEQRTGSRHAFR